MNALTATTLRRALVVIAAMVAITLAVFAGLIFVPGPSSDVRCSPGIYRCQVVSGRVIWVAKHDSDGDGDLHVVLASRDSVTGPGISVVKFARAIQPIKDPSPGDFLSAAGTRYGGASAGEKVLEVARYRIWR